MYGRGDSTPFSGDSSQSFLDLLCFSSDSHGATIYDVNLDSTETWPFPPASLTPDSPTFMVPVADYGIDDNGFWVQDRQAQSFWPISGLPDTPAELPDCPPENIFYPSPNLAFVGQTTSQLPDSNSQNVFRFPTIVVSKSPSQIPSRTAPPITSTIHSFEDQFISLETPPATPKQDAIDEWQFQQQPFPQRRARLGGVSTISSSSEPELDEMDIAQDDLNVFPDEEAPNPAATSGPKMTGRVFLNEPAEGDDLDVFHERTVSGPASTSHVSAADWRDHLRLKKAWQESKGSQSLQPLLKEELRLKILKKRLDSGQGELDIEVTEPPCYQMTEEEHARKDVRRAQNRGAARRFRLRKKQNETEMKKKLEENAEKKRQLTREVESLRREVSRLRSLLDLHRDCGDCRLLQAAVAPEGALQVPDIKSLCRQIGGIEDIDARPR